MEASFASHPVVSAPRPAGRQNPHGEASVLAEPVLQRLTGEGPTGPAHGLTFIVHIDKPADPGCGC